MMPTFTLLWWRWRRRAILASTVVSELELHAEILPAKERDRLLQVIARWSCHTNLIALDRCLNFFQMCVLDCVVNGIGGLAVERHLDTDFAGVGLRAARL